MEIDTPSDIDAAVMKAMLWKECVRLFGGGKIVDVWENVAKGTESLQPAAQQRGE